MSKFTDPRIGRARRLRREGKTYDEIRAVIGWVREDMLAAWLRGIPRPPASLRGRAKDDLRKRCRRLRSTGLSYRQIERATGASRGSLSLWLHDMPQRAEYVRVGDERRLAALRESCSRNRERRLQRRTGTMQAAADAVGPLTARELFLLGVGLYWAEGSKSKPWAIRDRITFINSDASMIRVFLAWLRLMCVPLSACRFRVLIHESADIVAAHVFWADVVEVTREAFCRPTLKRHRPNTVRLNVGENYHGCLVIDVLGSAELYRHVEGWWRGIGESATAGPITEADWAGNPPWGNWQPGAL